ncbi:hypothetical protein Droror1_Dr00018181 [Drosera rotundifolia]
MSSDMSRGQETGSRGDRDGIGGEIDEDGREREEDVERERGKSHLHPRRNLARGSKPNSTLLSRNTSRRLKEAGSLLSKEMRSYRCWSSDDIDGCVDVLQMQICQRKP